MDAAIRTAGLHKDFSQVKALDGLDLEVRAGEIHGFLGPNGAGKTTTPGHTPSNSTGEKSPARMSEVACTRIRTGQRGRAANPNR